MEHILNLACALIMVKISKNLGKLHFFKTSNGANLSTHLIELKKISSLFV